jgi:hypothetical protein
MKKKKQPSMSEHQSILLAHLKVMKHIAETGQPYPIPERR